jgi:hypothetical protein
MILADDFIQVPWAQAVWQRPVDRGFRPIIYCE